jgi:hypothetical protein
MCARRDKARKPGAGGASCGRGQPPGWRPRCPDGSTPGVPVHLATFRVALFTGLESAFCGDFASLGPARSTH